MVLVDEGEHALLPRTQCGHRGSSRADTGTFVGTFVRILETRGLRVNGALSRVIACNAKGRALGPAFSLVAGIDSKVYSAAATLNRFISLDLLRAMVLR